MTVGSVMVEDIVENEGVVVGYREFVVEVVCFVVESESEVTVSCVIVEDRLVVDE